MKILFYEIRKILRPSSIAVTLILYVLAGTILGPLAHIGVIYNSFNGEYYTAESYADNGKHAETVVKDMLIERYGLSLEGEELYDFIEFQESYSENLEKAVKENEYCKKYGITCLDDLNQTLYGILGSDYYEKDEDGNLVQCKEDAASRFFKYSYYAEFEYEGNKYIPEVKQWLDASRYHIESGMNRCGDDYVYYVFHTRVLHTLGMDLPILFCAAIACAMIVIIPYGVREIRSGISDIQYPSKTGKKIYLYKTLAVFISSALLMVAGVAIALIYYECLGVDRFGNTFLDSYYAEFDGRFATQLGRVYSQITVSDLLKIFSCAVFVSGIIFCGAVHIISEKCRNPITAVAACLPVFGVMILCGYRYMGGCIYPCNHGLISSGEGLVVLAVLAVVFLAVLVIDFLRVQKNKDQ